MHVDRESALGEARAAILRPISAENVLPAAIQCVQGRSAAIRPEVTGYDDLLVGGRMGHPSMSMGTCICHRADHERR